MKRSLIILSIFYMSACQKIEYTSMDSPAYLRVFNSLNKLHVLETKGDTLSYLCMLINPQFNAEGIPVGGEVVGDFLDRRANYAPPYPVHIGASTSVHNPEYPGKESVLAAPVLNGFDLSSWAQVPSGELRFVFMYRPRNTLPFFDLEDRYKRDVLVDTTLRLEAGEVYTMHTLLKDFNTKETGVLLRQETFHKQSLSDSLVYVNFYNYSAKGFVDAPNNLKVPAGTNRLNLFEEGIRDTMNIYLSLLVDQGYSYSAGDRHYADGVMFSAEPKPLDGYRFQFLGTMRHDGFSGRPAPYQSFPLWVRDSDDGINTDLWQRFHLLAPGLAIDHHPFEEYAAYASSETPTSGGVLGTTGGRFAAINCLVDNMKIYVREVCPNCNQSFYHAGANLPNLVVNTHSGIHNPRSFATVNTFEVINGQVYLTTIQRRYAAPIY